MKKSIEQLTKYKTSVMTSFRYCKRIYEGGIETPEQFETFTNICHNHVEVCNALCRKLKPKLYWLQWEKAKNFANFKDTCAYTIEQLQSMISEIQSGYDKMAEIEELRETMETKALIEYEIAQKIKQLEVDRIDEIKTYNKIGFNLNTEDNE